MTLTAVLGSSTLLSLAGQLAVARTDELHAYDAAHTRLYQLLAGATLASALLHPAQVRSRWPAPAALAVGSLATFALMCSSAWQASASVRGVAATVASIVGVTIGVPPPAGAGPVRIARQPNGLKSWPRTAPPGWLSVWMFM